MRRLISPFLIAGLLGFMILPLSQAQAEREFRYPRLHGEYVDTCINSPRFPSSERCSRSATKVVADMFCKELGRRNATDWFITNLFPRKMMILRETVGADGTTSVFEPKTGVSTFGIITCEGYVEGNHPNNGQDFSTVRVDRRYVDKCVNMQRFGSAQRCSYSAQFESATAFCRTKGWFRAQKWKLSWHLPTAHKIFNSTVVDNGRVVQSWGNTTGADHFTFIRCKWRNEP